MTGFADLLLFDAAVVDPARALDADCVAVAGGRILAVGRSADLRRLIGPQTRSLSCRGSSLLPGLIDGHAHLDREGLKSLLPSLAGARSIDDILSVVAEEVRRRRPGEWVVTMPVGTPPLYLDGADGLREGRWPTRHDLDRVAPDNPVFIRPIWGYWRNRPPLVSVANSLALRIAGIDAATDSLSPQVEIERDPVSGAPTGLFREQTQMSIVELTLMAKAPNFRLEDRIAGLQRSMAVYNGFGTTAVYEGHGVAAEVVSAYQAVRDRGRQTVRAILVLSPAWSALSPPGAAEDLRRMLRDWGGWAARRGFGDGWLRLQGVYAELDEGPEGRLRARAAPQTGWAGFNYDAGLPPALLDELLLEAARSGFRVSTIFQDVADLFAKVDRVVPIGGLRWVRGHIALMEEDEILRARDLGLVLVTHTNRHIAKMGAGHLARVGSARQSSIVPLRRLLDAGVSVALGSDNLPPSLFEPIADVHFRRDRATGAVIAPEQAVSREEAFALASQGGAWLLGREDELGQIADGYLADLVVVEGDVRTMSEEELRSARARQTLVAGQVVHGAPADAGAPAAGGVGR